MFTKGELVRREISQNFYGGAGFFRIILPIIIATLLLSPAAYTQVDFLRIGYINSAETPPWAKYDQLFDGTYTHIITTFLIPDNTGAIEAFDSANSFGSWIFPDAQAAGSKVLVSIGGSTVSYKVYTDIAGDPVARQNFIDNVVTFLSVPDTPDVEYDGVDINFEGWWFGDVGYIDPGQLAQVDQLTLDLAQAVKAADPNDVVTVTLAPLYFLPVSPSSSVVNSDSIDLAHHMSYDFMSNDAQPNGPFRAPGTQQWLYYNEGPVERSVWGALNYLDSRGYNFGKITGGVPFYTSDRQTWNDVRDDADWAAIALHSDYLEKQDPVFDYWANDTEAIDAKIDEYKNLGLRGVMVWEVGDEGGQNGDPGKPQGDLSEVLYGAATRPKPIPTPWPFPKRINYQRVFTDIPEGFVKDNGSLYGTSGEYGW